MKILAIDSSGLVASVAVVEDDVLLAEYTMNYKKTHSQTLLPMLNEIKEMIELDLNSIDYIAVAAGPGSFTGIRIGVSTAKAFAYACGKKVLGVTSFESLAYNIVEKVKKLTLIDARHDNFYACAFDEENNVILSPCFLSKSEIIDLYNDFLIISDVQIDGVDSRVGDLAKCFEIAVEKKLNLASTDRESLVPLYVKKSQAEEELC